MGREPAPSHAGCTPDGGPEPGTRLARRDRDRRIDLARGLALFIIFIDHNAFLDRTTFGWLTGLTLGRFSFIDAADVFFFLSGYVSGIVYTSRFFSWGLGPCFKKAAKRCAELYLAEVVLFLLCSALILSAPLRDTNAPWTAFHRLRDLPADTFRATLTLKNPPPFFGLLPIYMFFIGLTPIAIWLRVHRPFALPILCAGFYLMAQSTSGFASHIYADGFNPFAWQIIFFGGLALGFEKFRNPQNASHWYLRFCSSRQIVTAAIAGLFLILLLRIAPSEKLAAILHTDALVHLVPGTLLFTRKPGAEPLRIVNLCFWVIVVAAINPSKRFFQNRLIRLPIACGQNSLFVFCASVFLNYVMLIYARAESTGKALQLAWNLAGCGGLVLAGLGWKFLKAKRPQMFQLNFGVPIYLERGLQYLALVVYSIWQGVQGFSGNGPDL